MVSIKNKAFNNAEELCNWINQEHLDQSQIVSITSNYTLFYYE